MGGWLMASARVGRPDMLRFVLVRLGQAVMTLVIAVAVVFVSVRALPGDLALALGGPDATEETLAQIRQDYGLDQPLLVQLWRYFEQLMLGNLGRSAASGTPVAEMIGQALPVTLELAVLSIVISLAIGIPCGVVAAVRKGRPAEWTVNTAALLGLSVPNFWFGLMLILLFCIYFPILPASGFTPLLADPLQNLRKMVLPATVLGVTFAAIIMRQTRSAMLESLSADYMRTARAKGLADWTVITRHALRNSLVVVVTVVGLQMGNLISGAVVTEQVFVIPGLGKLTLDAVATRDYPLLQGVVLVVAAGYVSINLATDLIYCLLDPRIRFGDERQS